MPAAKGVRVACVRCDRLPYIPVTALLLSTWRCVPIPIRVSPKPKGRVVRWVDYASSPSLGLARLRQLALPPCVSPKIYVGMVDRESWPTRVVDPPKTWHAPFFSVTPCKHQTLILGLIGIAVLFLCWCREKKSQHGLEKQFHNQGEVCEP